jgi:uncharacterized membrane protein
MSKSKIAYDYISAVLKWGSYLSFFLVLIGLVLYAFATPTFQVTLHIRALAMSQLARELLEFKPAALINFGLLVLMLTPIFRVIVAIFSFVLERDLKYTLVASGVLAILIFSLLIAA